MRLGVLVAKNYRHRGKPVIPNPRRRLDFNVSTGGEPNPKGEENTKHRGVKAADSSE